VIDGEAIVGDDNGLAAFDLIRGHGRNGRAILCAFDLLGSTARTHLRFPLYIFRRLIALFATQQSRRLAMIDF
jgi:ATP-dependent DNA ligase